MVARAVTAALPAVPLSVLELATVASGQTPADALAGTLATARLAEELGFTRLWVAEHHNMPGIASSAPPVLLAAVGAATTTLRIGSGGVMLPNHAPLVVAEQFGTLAALHPGRVDLGIGRAPGTDGATASALRRSADGLSVEDFPQALAELRAFLGEGFPEGHPYRSISATPGRGSGVPVWLLGSSGYSAQLAGLLGLPFAFAHHFSAENTLPALQLYRQSFQPSEVLDRPYSMIAVQVVAAEDDEAAQALALPMALSFLRLRLGRPSPMPTVAEAAAHPWTDGERAFAEARWEGQAVGGPETVRDRLGDLLARTGADELMVTTSVPDPAAARTSLRVVRDLFGPEPLPSGLGDVAAPAQA